MTRLAKEAAVFIYGLADPRDNKIHYVGHTVDLNQRLGGHLNDKSHTVKTEWIASLVESGLQPIVIELARVDYDERFEQEYKWIYMGRAMGWPLTNTLAMKTEKYTHLFDGLGQTLVVEVDKGLTWRKIKIASKEAWYNDDSWKRVSANIVTVSMCLFSLSMILFDMAILVGYTANGFMLWVWATMLLLLLMVPARRLLVYGIKDRHSTN